MAYFFYPCIFLMSVSVWPHSLSISIYLFFLSFSLPFNGSGVVLLEEAKIRSLDDTVLLVGGEAVVLVVVVDLVVLTSINKRMLTGGVADLNWKLTV